MPILIPRDPITDPAMFEAFGCRVTSMNPDTPDRLTPDVTFIRDVDNSFELQKITAGSGEIRYKDKQELISSINSQVESLLDSKQKMKYDVLEKDWWSSINSEENDSKLTGENIFLLIF